jgi:hypothetical protein
MRLRGRRGVGEVKRQAGGGKTHQGMCAHEHDSGKDVGGWVGTVRAVQVLW